MSNLDLESTLYVIISECNINITSPHTKKPLKTLRDSIEEQCGDGDDALEIYGYLMSSMRDEIANGNVVTLGDMIHQVAKFGRN